jgi:hypothetical protein
MLHSWVAIDLEMSLFHDTPPKLDTTPISLPLPGGALAGQKVNPAAYSWNCDPRVVSSDGHTYTSLAGLFETFMEGQPLLLEQIPAAHLRLLLHPLQAFSMSLHNCLDTLSSLQTPGARANAPISLASATFMDEYMALLTRWHQLAKLVMARPEHTIDKTLAGSLVMYHLMVLSGLTSFPEVERLTRSRTCSGFTFTHPDQSWQRSPSLDGLSRIMIECGQCLSTLRTMPPMERPVWWAAAVYRVALVLCQSVISINSTSANAMSHSAVSSELASHDGPHLFFLDQDLGGAAEDQDRRFRHPSGKIPIRPVLMNADGNSVILESEICVLDYCLALLSQHVLFDGSGFARGILDELTELRSRWALHI